MSSAPPLAVHLVDGTYELFRHFYGLRRFTKGEDRPYGGVTGVLQSVVQMLEQGATHVGVATDHIIESFRNDLWPGHGSGASTRRDCSPVAASSRRSSRARDAANAARQFPSNRGFSFATNA